MNIITKIGLWIDTHFPEKISADEVKEHLAKIEEGLKTLDSVEIRLSQLELLLAHLEKDAKKMNEDLISMKTVNMVKSRQPIPIPDNMTAFAQRLPPVRPPTNGGNQ